MKKIFVLFFLLWLNKFCFSQQKTVVYTWEIAQKANPDTIFGISFKKMKLDSIPKAILKYKNLKVVDFSYNKLKNLPDFLSELSSLENIDFSKNKFSTFPEVIFKLENLQRLSFNRNTIMSIPESISKLKNLVYIDFWDNPIIYFPNSFLELKKLKIIHAEGIKYGPKFQQKWKSNLPNVAIFFDAPCDCVE